MKIVMKKLHFFHNLLSDRNIHIAAIAMCALYALAGILINLNRFWQFDLGYYDFGFFDRPIWELAHFKVPIIDHFIVGGKISLADHFNPSIFILTPIYWFTDRSEALLIVPSIAIGLSGYIIYKTGLKILKNSVLSCAVVGVYFLYLGTQNAMYSDFHELTVASAAFAATYWAIIIKSKKWFIIFLILSLGFKESLFIFGFSTGFFVFFYNKWRRLGIFTMLFSLIWGIFVLKYVLPSLSGVGYITPINLPNEPGKILSHLFTPPIKMETIVRSFLNFSFLPLLSPSLLPHIFLNFASRFLTSGSTRWDLGLHYNAEIAPTFAIATLIGMKNVSKKYIQKFEILIAGFILLLSFVLNLYIYKGPLILTVHPAFYQHTSDFEFLRDLVSQVPIDATVSAQNNLASYFLHHKEIWILRDTYTEHDPEYIVIDMREGQNPSGLLGIDNKETLFENLSSDNKYEVFYNVGDQYVFRRNRSFKN